jgi:hypothetical protein
MFYNPYRIDDVYDYEYHCERHEKRKIHYEHKCGRDTFRKHVRDVIKKWKESQNVD